MAFDPDILDALPVAILVTDADHQGIVQVNAALARLSGFSARELIGQHASTLLLPTNPSERLATAIRNLRHRDGSTSRVRLLGTSTENAAPHRIEMMEELPDSDPGERLRETQKAESLGLLASGLAHDFNNLLTAILGNASLSLLETPADSLIRPYLQEIEMAGQRAADLCHQLLVYAGRGRIDVGPVDLAQLVRESVGLLQPFVSKKARFTLDLQPDLPFLHGDASQIQQIVTSLVTNASDALQDREGTVAIRVGRDRFNADRLQGKTFGDRIPPGEYLFLEVEDTGCGMDQATRERIFDPFFTTKTNGRGLGLATVHGIVRSHGGAIRVESVPDQGTLFCLLFPPGFAQVSHPTPVPEPRCESWTGTVLVADDEDEVRRVIVRILRSLGFQAQEASDGQAALDAIRASPDSFDLLVLDPTLLRLNGNEVYTAIESVAPDLPVLIVSGYSEPGLTDQIPNSRRVEFLQKPFTRRTMIPKLRALLGPST